MRPAKKVIVHGVGEHERDLIAFVLRTRCDWNVATTRERGQLDQLLFENQWSRGENDVRLVVIVHEGRMAGDITTTNRTLRTLFRKYPGVQVLLLDLPKVMAESDLVGTRLAGVREMSEVLDVAWPLVFRKRGPRTHSSTMCA